jgi:hypothetical protein
VSSQVEICNNALTKLGSQRITSMADNTRNAQTLSAIWDLKRDAELASQPWTFAIKRARLASSTTAPVFGWAYSYPLPSDYLALVQVGEDYTFYNSDAGALFDVEGGAILTNQSAPLDIRYVSRVTNTGLYPALFSEALACRLAAEGCEAITQNLSKRQAAWDERKQALREARRVNAIEQPPKRPPDSGWVQAMTGA